MAAPISDAVMDADGMDADGSEELPAEELGKKTIRSARGSRTRQSFTWRQVSVLEQVFEVDPLPRQVCEQRLNKMPE